MWIDLRRVLPSHTIGEDCPLTNLSPSHEPKPATTSPCTSPRPVSLSATRPPRRLALSSPSPYRARPFPTILESETFPWPWMNSPQLSRPRLPSPTALGFSRSRPHRPSLFSFSELAIDFKNKRRCEASGGAKYFFIRLP